MGLHGNQAAEHEGIDRPGRGQLLAAAQANRLALVLKIQTGWIDKNIHSVAAVHLQLRSTKPLFYIQRVNSQMQGVSLS